MRIAVLCAAESWYFQDLCRAAGTRHELTAVSFSKLGTGVGAGRPRFWSGWSKFEQFDGVLVRTMPPGSLEQVVFRMDVLHRLVEAGCPVVNPPRAIETAVDKYLASARLEAAGLPTPPLVVCQTVADAMLGFEQLGRDVVVKPIFGSEGRGITRVTDENIALRVFKTLAQLNAVIYLQRFIEHDGFDLRLLVIGPTVLGMKRLNHDDWRTNVSRGATTEPLDVDEELASLARRAAACVGASLAGVDVLPARDGTRYVLEVNSSPGWKALAQTLRVDVAALVLQLLECREQRAVEE
jgi:ribosomal protein S6--L-glutamate ligase